MKAGMLRGAAMTLLLAIVLVPIYWMVAASLKSNKEITQDGTLYPHAPTFDNYLHLFSQKEFGSYLTNSLVVTAPPPLIDDDGRGGLDEVLRAAQPPARLPPRPHQTVAQPFLRATTASSSASTSTPRSRRRPSRSVKGSTTFTRRFPAGTGSGATGSGRPASS